MIYSDKMKRRMELEAQLNSKMKEIEQLRTELSQARSSNSEDGSGMGSSLQLGGSAPGKKAVDRKTKRMTKALQFILFIP